MKNEGKRRAIGLAVCLAVMMHLLLFMAIRPANGNGLEGMPVSPETHYLANPSDSLPVHGCDIRTIWSPVLFSLPSEIGFSRDLLQEKLHIRLTFKQPPEMENFLEIDPALVLRSSSEAGSTRPALVPQELMLTGKGKASPRLPSHALRPLEHRPAPRRLYMVPELKERLVGGIVLPPELNKKGDAAWEIRADISISRQGAVRHVFLEQPLKAAGLNQAIIHLLHGLRFKPGDDPVEGCIEIYSPEAAHGEGVSQ
ncbi:MAG: hypothetical protein KAH99_07275 [Verrucomicrobia bacterium]|nr:hypothetical protein [Verrucomicrobiota bacterium]